MGEDDATDGETWGILDLQGLKCPLPVLRTRKALAGLPRGRGIEVRCTDPLAAIDIPHLIRETGDDLLGMARDGRQIRFRIRRRGRPSDAGGKDTSKAEP